MEPQAFDLLCAMEKSWWYRGRAAIVGSILDRFELPRGDALDYGAGSGGMCELLQRFATCVYGFEPDVRARALAAKRGYARVYATEEEAFTRSYSLIGLLDVAEHLEDDAAALRRSFEALDWGGAVVLTVPAYSWMWSSHDERHHHFRRYDRRRVDVLLSQAGFEVIFTSYWNMLLLAPAAIMRLSGRTGERTLSLPSYGNAPLTWLIACESLLMRVGALPFGTSVVALGVKGRPPR